MQRDIVLVVGCLFLAAFLTTGCAKKKDKAIPPPQPDWTVWDNPSAPLAMEDTDPQGDDPLALGDTADWAIMRGTYDAFFAYLWLDVWGTPGLHTDGRVEYSIMLDLNGDLSFSPGDILIRIIPGSDWYTVVDYNLSVVYGITSQAAPGGGIDIAIPRSMTNETTFWVCAAIIFWDDLTFTDFQIGDEIPDTSWASFIF